MLYGTIVEYFPDKQFGFIRPDGGQDVFFHISVLEVGESTPEIKIGQPVKYEMMPRGESTPASRPAGGKRDATKRGRPKQTRAKVVILIDKIPGGKLAQSDGREKSNRHQRARRKKPTWRK